MLKLFGSYFFDGSLENPPPVADATGGKSQHRETLSLDELLLVEYQRQRVVYFIASGSDPQTFKANQTYQLDLFLNP